MFGLLNYANLGLTMLILWQFLRMKNVGFMLFVF